MENREIFGWVSWFRIFGVLLSCFLLLNWFFLWVNYDPRPRDWWHVSWTVVSSAFLAVTSIGLMLHRRWATVLFLLMTLSIAGFGIVATLPAQPLAARIFGVIGSLVVAGLPSYAAIKHWSSLR